MSRGQQISLGILAPCVVIYVLFQSVGAYFLSSILSVRVVTNDAVEECDSIRSRILGGKLRSEPPQMQGFGFCGIVVTDHGGFALPEPRLVWRLGVENRALIDRRLVEGRCYEVRAYGFSAAPVLGDALANRGHWEIISVIDEVACAS
jgi:hypothetical protein